MLSVRRVLITLALAFTAYMAARGFSWTMPEAIVHPVLLVGAMALCLATTWLCIFLAPGRTPTRAVSDSAEPRPARRRARLPLWTCVLALATALVTPTAVALAVVPDARTLLFANWYIGGIGALMTIVMVGRRPLVAWAGTILLTLGSATWMGLLPALGVGLVGSLMWVTAAQLSVFSLDRAAKDTAHLADLQQAASAWQASQVGRQRERRVRVQSALEVAGPVLARVVLTGGELTDSDRVEARLAEGRLRDELRGPRLLDDDVRAALEAARRAGTAVTVLDEGGLDGLDAESLSVIRAELAETVRGSHSGRLYIRTSPHDSIAVTVVGRQKAVGALSDDDSVDLWHEIPFPKQRDTRH
jgi:hypothetical protein